jgi:hypothetical protein
MHEKLVFIDDELLWSGSLNALGNLVPHWYRPERT